LLIGCDSSATYSKTNDRDRLGALVLLVKILNLLLLIGGATRAIGGTASVVDLVAERIGLFGKGASGESKASSHP
jgi:hypothetical protein